MERPPAPPEAVLIRLAREAADIRIAEAAKRAGVSVARWSQIEAGSEIRHGNVNPVAGRAGTIARMAAEVGLTAERMASEGQRPDAAEILAEIIRQRGDSRAAAPGPDPLAAYGLPPRGRKLKALEDSDEPGLVPYLAEVAAEVSRAMDEHGPDLTGAQAFPDRPVDQGYWDNPRLSGYERVRLVARMRRMSAEGGTGQRDRSVSGLAPAWHESGADGAVPAERHQAGVT